MATTRCLALLRAINVGGRNAVAMADLREAFEAASYEAVRTHIHSGNVLFTTAEPAASLEDSIEAMLERPFEIPLTVVVRTHRQLRDVVEKAPEGFGQHPDRFHSDVIFLKAPLTGRQAMRVVKLRDGVDRAWPARSVLYFARLSARRTASRMSSIVGTPEYKSMTIRSWSTTTKLLHLLDEG